MRILAILCIGLAGGCKGQDGAPSAAAPASAASLTTPDNAIPIAPALSQAPPQPSGSTGTPPQGPAVAVESEKKWDFESDKPGAPPAGFSFGRTGQGREGKWLVRAEAGAPGGKNVLAQSDADATDFRFPVAVADAPLLRDLALQVRCKPVSGAVDRACGMVFRYRDASNYYVTRANALEGNIRLYFVKDGQRHQIASFSGTVTSGAWHDYQVVAKGDHIEVSWDGAKVLDQHDKTFGDAGKVGLWTKADSVTYFDNLSVKPVS